MTTEENCNHYWIPNSGAGGEPVFRNFTHMSREPVMHVKCSKCNTRTWFTQKQWNDIPVRSEP